MAAAAVVRIAPPGTQVTLVESEEIGIVGVGEATIPTLTEFNDFLGLAEADVLRACQGTFKLGIEFDGWLREGESYFHPFGFYGRDTPEFPFHQLWLRLRDLERSGRAPASSADEIGAYNLCTAAARLGRLAPPAGGADTILSTMRYAYHLDATAYGRLLRSYAETRGARRLEGVIVAVERAGEEGDVLAVTLADGRRVEGDLFVDCSGFRSLLLGEALGTPFVDWSRFLPCDRALALPTDQSGPPPPFTRATADEAGWRWRIPLQHRADNGYVYASAFGSEDRAYERLLAGAAGTPLAEPRALRFRTGHRQAFWVRNVVGIGLAGGLIEPLESTSIHLAQMGVQRLATFWPGREFNAAETAAYNRLMTTDYERTRDFIVLHYNATARADTEFWRYVAAMEVPETLAEKAEMFRGSGRLLPDPHDLFTPHSWLAVMLGQGVVPRSHDALVERVPTEALIRNMHGLRGAVARTAAALPSHQDYIEANVRAPS